MKIELNEQERMWIYIGLMIYRDNLSPMFKQNIEQIKGINDLRNRFSPEIKENLMMKKRISVQRFFEIHIGLKEIREDYPQIDNERNKQLEEKTFSLERHLSDLIGELWEFGGVLYNEDIEDEENE